MVFRASRLTCHHVNTVPHLAIGLQASEDDFDVRPQSFKLLLGYRCVIREIASLHSETQKHCIGEELRVNNETACLPVRLTKGIRSTHQAARTEGHPFRPIWQTSVSTAAGSEVVHSRSLPHSQRS